MLSLVVLASCGATSTGGVETLPLLDDAVAAVFENGVDLMTAPEGLEGGWRDSWEEDMRLRVTMSDRIGIVSVETFRSDEDPSGRQAYRLLVSTERSIWGELAPEFGLPVREGEGGFSRVEAHQDRLLDQRFVAFLKRVNAGGEAQTRWHLSPASEQVLRILQGYVERRRVSQDNNGRSRVVIHRN